MRWTMKRHNKLKLKAPMLDQYGIKYKITIMSFPPPSDKQACFLVETEKERNNSLNWIYSGLMERIALLKRHCPAK